MQSRRRSILASLAGTMVVLASVFASPVTAADEEPVYHLPASEGTQLSVSQGNDESGGRSADDRYAYDFVADGSTRPRFPVAASRGGTVIGQRLDVRSGNCERPMQRQAPACSSDVNYVLIDHGDGTSGLYLHLARGEALVRPGQVVSAGQPLGSAGFTGWTDRVGLQFQVQDTPPWNRRSGAGWFMTRSRPVAFADDSVVELQEDGVPQTGDQLVSMNPPAGFEPFRFGRRPPQLPALVPLEAGETGELSAAYDAGSPDGYGLHFAAPETPVEPADPGDPTSSEGSETTAVDDAPTEADPGIAVQPLFGGTLVYAGCAAEDSVSLGRTVVIGRTVDDTDYYGVFGHLSEIAPFLLDREPGDEVEVGSDEAIGRFGATPAPGAAPALECPDADGAASDLFVGMLRDAEVTDEGEIFGGTPVSPEPLVGRGGYENLAGWAGPMEAIAADAGGGRPRANWTRRTPGHSSHIPFSDPVNLAARVRSGVDIAEVRLRAYYPAWARIRSSLSFERFDPRATWRQLAVCRPPGRGGEPGRTRGCRWNGDARDAIVSYTWDPPATEEAAAAPWLPLARTVIGKGFTECVPVALAVEVVDTAGRVSSDIGSVPLPSRCDQRAIDRNRRSRVIYLDPLVPPAAPAPRGKVTDRGWPPVYAADPLNGAIVWRDRSNNEDGFRIYVRRSWFTSDCSLAHSSWQRITTVPAGTKRYRPRHNLVVRRIPVPDIPDVPGSIDRWEYAVSSYNEAGESRLVPVGGFVGGSEAFCDPGLVPPDDL